MKNLPTPSRSWTGSIRIQKGGEEKLVSVSQFEAAIGAAFVPQLDFADISILREISEKVEKLHRKGELSQEQLWLGAYYLKEIDSLFFPDVIVRWIDERIGWGVFAARNFKKMEYIAEYAGRVRKRKREDKKNAYCFEYVLSSDVPTRYTIDAQDQGGIGRLINHSSQPNLQSYLVTSRSINHVVLAAKEPILAGQQLLFDYGIDYWSTRSKPVGFGNDSKAVNKISAV